eukprot:3642409-Rhodomonas_salina.1
MGQWRLAAESFRNGTACDPNDLDLLRSPSPPSPLSLPSFPLLRSLAFSLLSLPPPFFLFSLSSLPVLFFLPSSPSPSPLSLLSPPFIPPLSLLSPYSRRCVLRACRASGAPLHGMPCVWASESRDRVHTAC